MQKRAGWVVLFAGTLVVAAAFAAGAIHSPTSGEATVSSAGLPGVTPVADAVADPSAAARCAAIEDLENEVRATSDQQREALRQAATTTPTAASSLSMSFVQPLSVADVRSRVGSARISGMTATYFPLTGIRNYNATHRFNDAEPLESQLSAWRSYMLSDLAAQRAAASPGDGVTVAAVIARVGGGELPVATVRVDGTAQELEAVVSSFGGQVFAVSSGTAGAPRPFDAASLEAKRQACN